ncbi:MAG TPA: hypothetical protein VGL39_27845 [Jatrophihabitantaceae bacterium]
MTARTFTGAVVVDGQTFHPQVTIDVAAATGWPDASTTGVRPGVALTAITGDVTVSVGGTQASPLVYEGKDISGGLDVSAPWVIVRNCKIRGIGRNDWVLRLLDGDIVIEDCEIGDPAKFSYAAGVWSGPDDGHKNTIQRTNIYHFTRAVELNGNTDVLDNYWHDFPMGDDVWRYSTNSWFSGAHSSNMFISKGWHILIRGNSFSHGNSANVFVQDYANDAAGVGDITFDRNRFHAVSRNGQLTAYGIGFENKDVKGPVVVTNNVFDKAGWNVAPAELPGGTAAHFTTHTGNTYDDGTPADPDLLMKPVIY